jgi:organic hydroperoxide reductase OsmC/OhrA
MAGRHEHGYRLSTRWVGAGETGIADDAFPREFHVSIDGKAELVGSADPAFRGDSSKHNPEELLLAALSGCHLLSYLALAARARIRVVAYEDEATGKIDMKDGRIRFVEAVLRPTVTIAADADPAKAEALHAQAATICFIANSLNFPVRHEPRTLKR